ncbi:MAG: hypothetical protein UT05_C0006G0036 [Parcubacteria group bacterium GW2011_GWF2_38_76]|nr:MAG: hypothetical protein UT05_C0006G0036 [Parcubacteria group bacterium GW2011_GWF2_38_76]HBM45864.1 hypothetical protein [Patescibacteria group bacterium]
MDDNLEEGGIKKTEKRLYSQDPGNLERKRSQLSGVDYEEKVTWGGEEGLNIKNMAQTRKKFPILSLILTLSFVFFVGATIFATYLYLGSTNVISPDNVDISVIGPVSVKAGEEINLQVAITNKNNTALEYVELIATFPGGSKILTNKVNDTQYRKNLGTIKPNEIITETIKTALFGEENADREVIVAIEYRNENSNAIMEKETIWKTIVSSSPLSLIFDMPTDANSNQEITLNVKTISNSKDTMRDVVLNVAYPSGFIFKEAIPKASSGNGVWFLGDFKQGEEKLVKIKGVIQGQNEEERAFRVIAGQRTNKDSTKVEVAYASSLKTLVIRKSFISANLAFNGNQEDTYVITDGQSVRGDIEWENNLPVNLLHAEMNIKLIGDVFDKSSINSSTGFYNSADNTIVWNKSSGGLPDLISSGQSNRLSFSFSPLPLLSGKRTIFRNPELNFELTFKGFKSSETREADAIVETTLKKKIKISSNLQVSPRALYFSGPFKNTGPLPPVHDNETTYTVVWSVVNSSNDVSDVAVKTTLPPYVRWLGVSSPNTEAITYNPLGGEISWNVGSVKAGSGITVPAREVAFQVAMVPSLGQIGQYPSITADTIISGHDEFTGSNITYSRKAVSSQLTSDPLVQGSSADSVK